MFNEYSVYQIMKLRKEETERNARDAWRHYPNVTGMNVSKEISVQSNQSIMPCCECTC